MESLKTRIAVASMLLAFVFVFAFVQLVSSIQSLRASGRAAQRSEQVVAGADRLEKLVLDLETGERGYVISGERIFLEPFTNAVRRYPAEAAKLEALVAKEPQQHARAIALAAAISNYRLSWADRVIATARRNPAAAGRLVSSGGGKHRVDQIRKHFADFVSIQDRISTERRVDSGHQARRAIFFGILAAVGSALLIIAFACYLFRLVVEPVRRFAEGAQRLARGELSGRVPEGGVGEIAKLGRDFNSMAAALEHGQQKLAHRKAELQAVLNATVEGICMTDVDGRLLFANRTMESFWAAFGLRDEGTIWDRLVRLAARTTTPDAYHEIFGRLASDPTEAVDAPFTMVESGRSFVGHAAPVLDSGDQLVGRVFSIREVTAERVAERMKDEFVATVSHELRTPLTSIVGYAELLTDPSPETGELTPLQTSFVDIIERNAQRLHCLVGDLLFLAQVEAGRMNLEFATLDLRELAVRAVKAAQPAAAEQDVALDIDAPVPVEVVGDAARLDQLLDNLLSNAVKFTPDGGRARIRLGTQDDEAVIEVEDSGIGIAKTEIDRLFSRFFRASSALDRQVPGTGLGLAIAKTIVEAHRGRIDIRSELGAGTTFCVRLPLDGAVRHEDREVSNAGMSS